MPDIKDVRNLHWAKFEYVFATGLTVTVIATASKVDRYDIEDLTLQFFDIDSGECLDIGYHPEEFLELEIEAIDELQFMKEYELKQVTSKHSSRWNPHYNNYGSYD